MMFSETFQPLEIAGQDKLELNPAFSRRDRYGRGNPPRPSCPTNFEQGLVGAINVFKLKVETGLIQYSRQSGRTRCSQRKPVKHCALLAVARSPRYNSVVHQVLMPIDSSAVARKASPPLVRLHTLGREFENARSSISWSRPRNNSPAHAGKNAAQEALEHRSRCNVNAKRKAC